MKRSLTLCLAFCASIFFVSCKTTTPTAPVDNSKGTPTAVGTPIGAPTTKTIDASGGSLMSPDGRLELIIPPNALSAVTAMTIQPITNLAPLGAGIGFSLTPHGQTFTQPVTLRFHYTADDRKGTDVNALGIATQKDDKIWYASNVKNLDTSARTLSVTTTHFSGWSLYRSLRISPEQASVKINGSKEVTVQLVAPAGVDDAPDDMLSPLVEARPYPNAEEISWTLNGSKIGSLEDGILIAEGNTATASYKAPTTNKNMTSNPVAVTAEVDIVGPSKLYLISNITVTDAPGLSGTVRLTLSVNDSKTNPYNNYLETKSEIGEANFEYTLVNEPIDVGINGSIDGNWNEQGFTGTSTQTTEHTLSYPITCSGGGKDTRVQKDKTVTTFSGPKQVTGLGIQVADDNTYSILIGPPTSLTAAASVSTQTYGGCDAPAPTSNNGMSSIPYAYYFIPYIGGGAAKTIGKIDPAKPNEIKGKYDGTAIVTLFSPNTEPPINLEIPYTITWDLKLSE